MNLLLEIEYNGSKFSGWQIQPDMLSVQEKIESALKTILKRDCGIVGSGRTDAGVHALKQIANFNIDETEIQDLEKFQHSLNALCGNHIVIHRIKKVSDEFHSRYSATSRSYCYKISLKKRAIDKDFWYIVGHELDFDLMQQATKKLLGEHDFRNLSSGRDKDRSTICDIKELKLEKNNNEILIYITANRFIRKMVRMIAGLLVDIGRKKVDVTFVNELLNSKKSINKTTCAPAHALTFLRADYPDKI